MKTNYKPKLTLFHCINSFHERASSPLNDGRDFKLNVIKLPCSSIIKDVVLLKAFEAGSDGVLVFVCLEGQCRFIEGNVRAKKRVEWVQGLLDEIGLDGRRLSINNVSLQDEDASGRIIREILSELKNLGPNPAA